MGFFETYFASVKTIHVASVILSGSLFFLRGVWVIQQSNLLSLRAVRIAPHIIDTVLLISAILLTIELQQYPVTHGWLTAKVVALLVYIGLGTVAIRRGRDRQQRIISWIAALAVFSYMVVVAMTHSATLGIFT